MPSAAVLPLHDPDCLLLPHLVESAPLLAEVFDLVYLGITQPTRAACPGGIAELELQDNFRVMQLPPDLLVGDHLRLLYRLAVQESPPECLLHLCFPDRLIFALETQPSAFLASLAAAQAVDGPVLFQRSAAAWETHPRSYRAIENFATIVGEFLFHRSLDFAWCHLALRAGRLSEILPRLHRHDFSVLAEIVLQLKDELRTEEVDWLAWEDPFLLGSDPQVLKAEREASSAEVRKRLGYIIPMLQRLLEHASGSMIE